MLGKSDRIRSVETYSALNGSDVVYTVQIRLRGSSAHSPNIAFEALAEGRSFEDARALQARLKEYFTIAPIVAEHRVNLSLDRSSVSMRRPSAVEAK